MILELTYEKSPFFFSNSCTIKVFGNITHTALGVGVIRNLCSRKKIPDGICSAIDLNKKR